MALPHLALAAIGDEIASSVDEMIAFCRAHGLRRLDMRTVDDRNLLGMELAEVKAIAAALHRAGLEVPTFVSPVLKWPAPGQAAATGKVDFAFDPADRPGSDPVLHAFEVAKILGARRLRCFSFLRHPGFGYGDLDRPMARLLELADRFDVEIEVENERVCNIGSLAELAGYFRSLPARPSHLRPLVDIGNGWAAGEPPTDAEIAFLAPMVDLIHVKDRDLRARRGVPIGDGGVPWAAELTRLLRSATEPQIVASLEIHCFDDRRNAMERSLAGFRRIADEVGVEIV